MRRKKKQNVVLLKRGWRSGLEKQFMELLNKAKVPFKYEQETFKYTVPEKVHKYTPDFILPGGTVIETKGQWGLEDRKKISWFVKQHPEILFRMVFSNPHQRINKKSKTRYADICNKLKIPWCSIKDMDTCLLYTSPSPRDRTRSRMPSSA